MNKNLGNVGGRETAFGSQFEGSYSFTVKAVDCSAYGWIGLVLCDNEGLWWLMMVC